MLPFSSLISPATAQRKKIEKIKLERCKPAFESSQNLRSVPLPHPEQHYNYVQNPPQSNSVSIISTQNLEISL